MEIRLLDKNEYELSKALWLDCFPEDDRSFVDLYYSKRSKPEYVLGAFEDALPAPVAMMHMIPMKMPFGDSVRDVCFVAGVCTDPLYRRRGICAKLIEKAFEIMRARHFDAAVLEPFRASFYERFGFKTFIYRDIYKLSAERLNDIGQTYEALVSAEPNELARQYSAFLKGYSGHSVRDVHSFEYFIEEYSLKGAVLHTTANGCCAGYAEEGKLTVNELFFIPGTDPLSIIPKGYKEYSIPLPAGFRFDLPLPHAREGFSMIRSLSEGFDPFLYRNYGFDMY